MQVAVHLGAHCTDDGLLVTTLLKSRTRLAAAGVVVAHPWDYRPLLQTALEAPADAGIRAVWGQTLPEGGAGPEGGGRLVLSAEDLLGPAADLGRGEGLYPLAGARVAALCALFPQACCEFHLAIRNPATLFPALLARARPGRGPVLPADPAGFGWAGVVARMRAAAPAAQVTVWCDEEAPVLWPEILRAVAGVGPGQTVADGHRRLAGAMTPQGLARLVAYLAARPPATAAQRQRIVAAFLARYPRVPARPPAPPPPGWNAERLTALTAAYAADRKRIAQMPGVRLIGLPAAG